MSSSAPLAPPLFLGIDLGTSNSVIAAFDGESVNVLASAVGESLTPSVVRVDAAGAVSVGRRALRFADADPSSVRREFKRLMGTAERLSFGGEGEASAGARSMLPEELSAAVLSSLLADARDALGFTPRAAVISVPAMFELPQSHATARAGELAGLEEVVLIQEPIAGAIAAGWRADAGGQGGVGTELWMVFDLGGGTLDVSLLETRDGRLRVVDHAGDNFLGGKDIDAALADWAAAELERQGRACPANWLRPACEQAKIELGRAQRTTIVVPGPGGVELPLSRHDLAAAGEPVIARSLDVVRRLVTGGGRQRGDIGRVVFVGGSTLLPGLRARVAAVCGAEVAEGVDPMTAVARGAALFAGTAGVSARRAPVAAPRSGLAVRIEHPPVTADLRPWVVGRFLPAAGRALPEHVRIERADGDFRTPDERLSPEGSFVLQVALEPRRMTRFTLRAFDAAGADVQLASPEFSIVHGMSIADPPLARAIGVACADDGVHGYFAKGTPLPARRTFVHHTVRPMPANGPDESGDDALAIPVVQGESARAHRNRLVGKLSIRGPLEHDLPVGTRIEVTLELDRSGRLRTRADIPALGRTFEEVAHVLVPSATLETAERELAATAHRADEIQRRAFEAGAPTAVEALSGVAAAVADAERGLRAARRGDADAALKLHRALLDLATVLDDAEAILAWPEIEREARGCVLSYAPLVSQWGTAAEQQIFDQALAAANAAQKRRDAGEIERQLATLRTLGKASYCRNPEALPAEIDWLAAHVTESVDVPRAQALLDRARAAARAGETGAARAALAEVWDLVPSTPEMQRQSFGSGVR